MKVFFWANKRLGCLFLFEMYHHVTFWRTSVVYQHAVIILNEVVGTEPALDKVLLTGVIFRAENMVLLVLYVW